MWHTDTTVLRIVRKLQSDAAEVAAGRLKPKDLETLEVQLGWNHSPDNFLLDESLGIRPISSLMHDWMHILVANWVYNVLILFMSS